jgi:hypothetical protein
MRQDQKENSVAQAALDISKFRNTLQDETKVVRDYIV